MLKIRQELGDERRKFAKIISEYDREDAEEVREAWDQNKDLREKLASLESRHAEERRELEAWINRQDGFMVDPDYSPNTAYQLALVNLAAFLASQKTKGESQ